MTCWLIRSLILLAASGAAAPFCAAQAQFASSGPILPSERQTTESPRTVEARAYRDAYCAIWTDGCTTCERKSANEQPACRDAVGRAPSCQLQRIACRAVLPTIGRVCLVYSDGCNTCAGGACTAKSCNPVPFSGQRQKPFTPDFTCRHLRRTQYESPALRKADLVGHWRLTDDRGKSCDLFIRHDVIASPACHAIHPALADVKDTTIDGTTLRFVDRKKQPLLPFDISDLDSPRGLGEAGSLRLTRLK